ncbi:MAG: tRNA (N(6)-L-threonylcarbamoyladenosine(37)-C(2))-methylthiotransferase [Nanoarchaeota archaeon]|nr:tRNA (N(6)-L-threonylcarbamoyladenosine(37)-C(2))-methylthiotransferase [Nanoarchaeota archaeon]
MVKIDVIVYGCTASKDEGNIIKGLITKEGYKLTKYIKFADVIVIVSCIVKSQTESRIRAKIKEIQLKYPNKKLIVAGCMPEAMTKECRKLAPDAPLINTFNTNKIVDVIKNLLKNKRTEFLGKGKESKLNLVKVHEKEANIQIAQGCRNRCSFCLTKFAKGDLVSYPEEDIINEIKNLVKKNYKRINITSTDNSCYGFDIGTNLVNLLKKIVKVKGDFKVRVGMMNPGHILNFLDELIEVYKDDKIIKFLHIPIESGSDKILKDMGRGYNVKDFKKIVKRFRKEIPNINISTDIIVGFPTEDEKDFNQTLDLIKEVKPEVLNISKFGPRPGTKAAKMKQLKSEIIKDRSRRLTKLYKK